MVASLQSSGIFAITRTKVLLLALLIACWSVAHILPSYQDAIQARLSAQIAATRERIPSIKISFNPNTDPRTKYNQTKLAVLIEGRPQPELVPHILHMIAVVPQDWRFLFIGSNKSVTSVGRSVPIKYQQAAGKLDLMVMNGGAENAGVGTGGMGHGSSGEALPWDISNKEGVWRMLTDMRFYDAVMPGVEWMLKFESDSILCANSDQSLNEWLDYDWAAAPRTPDDKFAGNGGLSIRRISAVRRILGFQVREPDSQPEDEWFGKRIISMPDLRVATGAQAQHFSVEDVYHEKPMGYHLRNGQGHLSEGVWKNKEQRKSILRFCPDLGIILRMKLERERCEGDTGEGEIIKVEGLGDEKKEEGEGEKKEGEEKKEEERNEEEEREEEEKEEEEKEGEEEEEEEKEEEEKEEEEKEEEEKEEEKEPTPEEVKAAKAEALEAKIEEERKKQVEADAKAKEESKKEPKAEKSTRRTQSTRSRPV